MQFLTPNTIKLFWYTSNNPYLRGNFFLTTVLNERNIALKTLHGLINLYKVHKWLLERNNSYIRNHKPLELFSYANSEKATVKTCVWKNHKPTYLYVLLNFLKVYFYFTTFRLSTTLRNVIIICYNSRRSQKTFMLQWF